MRYFIIVRISFLLGVSIKKGKITVKKKNKANGEETKGVFLRKRLWG
jgi:hypothetical protein